MSENISTSALNFHQKHEESRHGYKKLEYDTVFKQDTDSSRVEQDDDQEDEDGFMLIDRETIRIDVQCPICLGIIKKTRTMMECMHRFCKECIDKSMRLGNNECPACRTHCASRRSLRDDPRFDELISALYPDIQKVEEEELAFCEEDEARDKQIRESIAQVHIKQSEALGKKRAANKDSAGTSVVVSKRKKKNKSTIEHIEEERDSCPASTCEPLRLSWGQFGVRSYNRHRANLGLATMVDSHRNTEKIDDVPKALVIPSEDVKVDAIANDSRDHQSVPQSYSDNKPSIANGTTSGEHPMLQYKKKSSFRIVLSRKR